MSRPRGPDGQFLPKPWPLDENGKPKREALAAKDPIAVAHREEKPFSKEEKEKRRKVPREESGKRDPATGQLQGGIPGHEGAFGRVPAELREHLRGSAAERVKVLEQIADDPNTTPRDRMQAIDLLFRYGLGPVTSHDVTVDHSFSGLFAALSKMPTEHLKRLEDMNDEQLSQTLNFMLGNGQEEAAEELKRKLDRMAGAKEIEARTEASPPRKALPKARKAEPKPRPDRSEEVIAEFYDGGLPKATQEAPVEEVEAITEESEPVPRKDSYFYSQNGARVIPISEFGYVRKS
jgi:Rod binding domain-containing protein